MTGILLRKGKRQREERFVKRETHTDTGKWEQRPELSCHKPGDICGYPEAGRGMEKSLGS